VGTEQRLRIIRWIDGHKAGVEFDSPLYVPVVEHLAQRCGADCPVPISHG